MRTLRISLVAAVAAVFGVVALTEAQTIGLGPNATWINADGGGGRTNVEEQFVTLGPGTYAVSSFQYTAINNSGTVQPFLATKNAAATDIYTPIWTEPATAPSASSGTIVENYATGSQLFTLATTSNVYAGFVMTQTAVGHTDPGPLTSGTDHNGSPLAIVVGVPLNGGVSMSNNNLSRNYAFSISVAQVPEPTSMALWSLLGLGLAAFGYRRFRRNK